jgi:hypothetical protein
VPHIEDTTGSREKNQDAKNQRRTKPQFPSARVLFEYWYLVLPWHLGSSLALGSLEQIDGLGPQLVA